MTKEWSARDKFYRNRIELNFLTVLVPDERSDMK